ncbi:extensin family protein [Terrihabitans soli]|uniref:extensin family protein n=1 Tax=Terrihabitans soli TaxID=708113 RepID=UPI001CA307AA|nr:extensin family protein [Terrihabitans soli]
MTLAASAAPAGPPLHASSLISEIAAAIDGKTKKPKKKRAASSKPAKAPLPKPRPEALAAKPAPATEATPKDGTAEPKPTEASTEPKPEDIAKIPAPVPTPRPDALTVKPPAAEAKKNEEKKAEEKKAEKTEKSGKTEKTAEKPEQTKENPASTKTSEHEMIHAPVPESDTAEFVPLPAPRPKNIKPDYGPHPPPPGLVEAEVPNDPLPDPVCDELEAKGEIEFERLPRIMEGQCGALTPIRLKAFTPKDGPKVTLENPVTTSCQVAGTALGWLTTSVQPAAIKHLGGTIREFRQTGGYECRGRNRDPSAKMSEHGIANALDIGGFERENGVVVPVSDKGEAELGFLNDIRKEACGPFTTVLGPGVAAHEEHFHLDLARRGKDGRTTYCR